MRHVHKAFVVLAAAIAMDGLAVEGPAEEAGETPKGGAADRDKDKARKKDRVQKVKKARKRPADWDDDFAMPAGTLYDVMTREDLR